MTAFVLALVMAAALAVTAYAATVTVKYRVYVYSDEITFRQYDYSQSTTPSITNLTISATSSLGSGSALYHMKYADGAVAYCIEPGVHSDDSGTYKEGSSASWYNLPASVQSGIALAMSLGYPSADYGAASGDRNSSAIINAEKWAATQAIIWELICEYRNAYTYDDWEYSPFYGCVDTSHYPTFGLWYDKIAAALMALSLITTAFAATDSAPTIDPRKKASLSIYKYDITKAGTEGAWDAESYVSTGLHDDAVVDKLAKYAIQGVEFTYLRVADITMNNELVDGQRQVGVLYGFDNSDRSTAVLSAIGLTGADAHKTENGINCFTSDMLNNKLAAALAANATTVKNALEAAVKSGGGVMTETDATGNTSASDMEQGLYLVVETCVPENVTSTCNPFFVSLPMTTIDGTAWNYDVTVYPKNQTGNPTLDKTVREDKNSTGKNTGSLTDITDGYAHTASASIGDTVDYQIISTLPTITSKASVLSEYAYVDTMSKGIKYNKNDVAIEFFKDSGCTDKITTWAEDSGKFTVAYDDAQNIMTIRMTEAGLSEINEEATVYTDSVKRGYSDCTMRITYAATLTADAATYGDRDNPNKVKLTWKRTNTTYFDTLEDCCHVYVYAIDLIKQFSDNNGTFGKVKFIAYNDTDGYYIKANMEGEVYNVIGFTSNKSEATMLIPNLKGHIILRGIEDDAYSLTEIATDKGYVLLKDAVKIVIKTAENGQCEKCGAKLLTASATVNGKDVTMSEGNAVVPLTVVNNPGFDLPKSGGYGTWMFTIGGVVLLGAAAFIVIRSRKHKGEH